MLTEADRAGDAHVTVMHAEAREEAEQVAASLKESLGSSEILIMDLVPAIITHAGPGALAVGFFTPVI